MWWRLIPVLFPFAVVLKNRMTLSLNTISVAVRHFYGKFYGLNGYTDREKDTTVIFALDEPMIF